MQFLLDTDTCIDLLRGRKETVGNAEAIAPDDCAVSTVTTYELLTGAQKCRNPEVEREKIAALLATVHELPFDRDSADQAARIRSQLEEQGVMIGPYDVLLAGQAMAARLTLVTSNTAEFNRVNRLRTADWRQ